jgi:hypothetical protein
LSVLEGISWVQAAKAKRAEKIGWFQNLRDHTFSSCEPVSEGSPTSSLKWSVT